MADKAKLRVAEFKVLKKEEEVLKSIINQYKNMLNALKVEELTLCNKLGTTQDKALRSRNSTPVRTQSRDSMGTPPVIVEDINSRTLNLSAVPLLDRFLEEQNMCEMEEESDEDECLSAKRNSAER